MAAKNERHKRERIKKVKEIRENAETSLPTAGIVFLLLPWFLFKRKGHPFLVFDVKRMPKLKGNVCTTKSLLKGGIK